jgi:hypothetical protein
MTPQQVYKGHKDPFHTDLKLFITMTPLNTHSLNVISYCMKKGEKEKERKRERERERER